MELQRKLKRKSLSHHQVDETAEDSDSYFERKLKINFGNKQKE